jgi:hypothetical protein
MRQTELFTSFRTTSAPMPQIAARVAQGELFPEFAGSYARSIPRTEAATIAAAIVTAAQLPPPADPTPKVRAERRGKTEKMARKVARMAKQAARRENLRRKAINRREEAEVRRAADPWAHLPAHPIDRNKDPERVAVNAYREAYRLAKEASTAPTPEHAARLIEQARAHFAIVVEVTIPETRFSARTGSLVRRALGISNPSANLLKYSTGKTAAEHFSAPREERDLGRGVYIAAHARGNRQDGDAYAAAEAASGRAWVKMLEYINNGEELPHCRQVVENPECRDRNMAAFMAGLAARIYREEVYGRHRANCRRYKSGKPVALGEHDPVDYRQDIGKYTAESDTRLKLVRELAHAMSLEEMEPQADLDPLRRVYGFAARFGGSRAGRPRKGETVTETPFHEIMGSSRANGSRITDAMLWRIMGHIRANLADDMDLDIIGERLELVRIMYRFCTLLNLTYRIKNRA